MTKTEKELLEQMKDELHREFAGDKQWVLAVAKREMSETEKEQHPNYDTMLSLLMKTTSSSLIDGTTLHANLSASPVTIAFDELLDGPSLMGTTIEDGLLYLCRNSELFYMDLEGDGY